MPVVYFRDKPNKILHADLFDVQAERTANNLGKISSAQFRNYFAEIRGLEARLDAALEQDPAHGFDRVKPYLRMVNAKLAYGQRSKGNTSREFAQFLGDAVNAVNDAEDFRAMVQFVEAVLAYFYLNESQNRDAYRGGRR
jgi:CRISPR-associated protein Csm2